MKSSAFVQILDLRIEFGERFVVHYNSFQSDPQTTPFLTFPLESFD